MGPTRLPCTCQFWTTTLLLLLGLLLPAASAWAQDTTSRFPQEDYDDYFTDEPEELEKSEFEKTDWFNDAQPEAPQFEGRVEYRLSYWGGELGEHFAHLLPEKLVVWFGPGALRMQVVGPLAAQVGEVLIRTDSDTLWLINDSLETAYWYSLAGKSWTEVPDSLVRREGRIYTIAGLPCAAFRTVQHNNLGTIEQRFFTTQALPVSLDEYQLPGWLGLFFFTRGVTGFPVRLDQYVKRLGLNIRTTYWSRRAETQPADYFRPPPQYRRERFSPTGPTPLEP